MFKRSYYVVEEICKETEEHRGEYIIRTVHYDSYSDAYSRMLTLKPKENGKLMIKTDIEFVRN